MTNDDLKLFVGRYVMVQFREQQWMVPNEEGGKPMPAATNDPQSGSKVPLVVPFLVAKLIERNGVLVYQFMDFRVDRPAKLETIVNPDVIFTVTAISEEPLLIRA